MLEPAPRDAVLFVAVVGLSTLLLLVASDLVLTLQRRLPVGSWVTQWARRYPAFALALTLVAGGLFGHFYFATP
ncbi:MAG: hypothetical protein E6I08_13430 [Chloroflexi bacterium]|nr:MAG: hypothetical protein E6I08_13430 [Chloroflexota bacterium]